MAATSLMMVKSPKKWVEEWGAARAFGSLRSSIFDNQSLSVYIKRSVYQAMVMSIATLLYGSETWTMKSPSMGWLEGFHNCFVLVIMSISKTKQCKQRITSRELAGSLMTENMADIIRKHRCRWLGHLARMDNRRLPKYLLFGELIKTRPSHAPKRHCMERSSCDGFGIRDWYELGCTCRTGNNGLLFVRGSVHLLVWRHVATHTYTHIATCIHTHACTHTQMHTHASTHTCTHSYTCIQLVNFIINF